MVISAGLFSQIKYIYIEDLRSSQISLLGGVRLRSGLEVCISHPSVLLRLSVNHALVKSKSRGKWDAGEAEKKARAIVVRSWEGFGTVGAPRSQASCSEEEPEDAEQLLQLRAPSWCPRAQGHAEVARGCAPCTRGVDGCRRRVPVVGWMGQMGAAPFCPMGIRAGWVPQGAAALSGRLVSLSFIFSGQSQEMGLGRGWKAAQEEGAPRLLPPSCSSLGGLAHLCAASLCCTPRDGQGGPHLKGGSTAGGCPHRGARG